MCAWAVTIDQWLRRNGRLGGSPSSSERLRLRQVERGVTTGDAPSDGSGGRGAGEILAPAPRALEFALPQRAILVLDHELLGLRRGWVPGALQPALDIAGRAAR